MCMPAAWREFLEFEACSSLAYVFFKSESQHPDRTYIDKHQIPDTLLGHTGMDKPLHTAGLVRAGSTHWTAAAAVMAAAMVEDEKNDLNVCSDWDEDTLSLSLSLSLSPLFISLTHSLTLTSHNFL